MTRAFFALSFLFASYLCANAAPQRLIAFERGTAIWIANLDGTQARKITKGSAPDLSPDGTRIAFHTDDPTKKDVVRQIAVVEVMTKKLTVFKKEIPSENCQRAIWSPDGQHILFSIWSDSDWHLAMIDADGSNFRYAKKAALKNNSYWSACWAPDGKSFYAQDLSELCQFTLDGVEIKKWNLRSLFPKGSLSSGTTIAIAPDGKKLLIDVEMEDESVNVTDWEGPPPSMWILDLVSDETTRLTPKGILAWHGCWLNDKEILFTSQAAGEKEPSVYQMSVSQKDRKPLTLIKNANNPTVSP